MLQCALDSELQPAGVLIERVDEQGSHVIVLGRGWEEVEDLERLLEEDEVPLPRLDVDAAHFGAVRDLELTIGEVRDGRFDENGDEGEEGRTRTLVPDRRDGLSVAVALGEVVVELSSRDFRIKNWAWNPLTVSEEPIKRRTSAPCD